MAGWHSPRRRYGQLLHLHLERSSRTRIGVRILLIRHGSDSTVLATADALCSRTGVKCGTMSDFETVTPTEVPEGAQLIDIREPDEFNQWHAEGATNLPLSELQARYGEFDLDRDVYLICLSGGRSAKAAQWLEMNGIDTINVGSGTIGWRDAGLPIVGTEG